MSNLDPYVDLILLSMHFSILVVIAVVECGFVGLVGERQGFSRH